MLIHADGPSSSTQELVERDETRMIDASQAASIAALWGSSGLIGKTLAAFSMGAKVESTALRQDIINTIHNDPPRSPSDVRMLLDLYAWTSLHEYWDSWEEK